MGNGLVIEQGTHSELLQDENGPYSRLVTAQKHREKREVELKDSDSDTAASGEAWRRKLEMRFLWGVKTLATRLRVRLSHRGKQCKVARKKMVVTACLTSLCAWARSIVMDGKIIRLVLLLLAVRTPSFVLGIYSNLFKQSEWLGLSRFRCCLCQRYQCVLRSGSSQTPARRRSRGPLLLRDRYSVHIYGWRPKLHVRIRCRNIDSQIAVFQLQSHSKAGQ